MSGGNLSHRWRLSLTPHNPSTRRISACEERMEPSGLHRYTLNLSDYIGQDAIVRYVCGKPVEP